MDRILSLKVFSFYKYLVFGSFALLVFYIFSLSREVSFQQVNPTNASKISFSLDFCYELSIRGDKCRPSYSGDEIEKLAFPENCSFAMPIECYTKDFRNWEIGEILQKFKECRIENLIKIDRPANISYKLFFGNICVKNRFEIDFKNGSEIINIHPQQREQIFSITVSSKRLYERESVYKSPIVSIMRRYCWTDPFPPVPNQTKYYCSEDGRKVRFRLDYFSVKSLAHPYLSNCITREDSDSQAKCYQACVKKEKPHFFMTYRNFSSKSKLTFDNATIMQDLVNRCLGECSQPDCNYGSFDVANIINETGNGTIALEITPTDHRTEVIPLMSKESLAYCLVIYVYLLFGWNFYETFLKNLCLKGYFSNLKRKKKRQKQSCKLAAFSFSTLLVGLAIGTLCEWQLFNFGLEDKTVVIKRESTYEINITTSICFNLSDILLDRNASYTDKELFETKSLIQLNELTWSVEDFKKVSSMKNSVGPVPIRHKEKEIWVFYRDYKKCFSVYYETKQLFPHIYLQRKSHIYFNVTGTEYSHFYVEQNKKYPQLESPKIDKSTLFTLRQNNFKESNCKRYTEERDHCLCKDDCVQDCVVKEFVKNKKLPVFANVKERPYFFEHGSLYFSDDRTEFEKILAQCEASFPEIECDAVNITLRPKYIVEDQHNISINLTPNIIVHKELNDGDRLVVFNRIIGVLVILTGFSVRELFDELLSILYNLQAINRFVSLPTLLNFRLAKRLVNLLVFSLFAVHFVFLYNHIISHEMLQISYKNFLDTISLPKLRVCYETGIDLNQNKYTKDQLDAETLKMEDLFIGLHYLDDDFNRVFTNISVSNNNVFKGETFYLDNLKCFSIAVKKTTPVANANILLIDQLVTVFIDLQNVTKKRYLVYLNVENTIDLEWSTYLLSGVYYNLYFSTKQFFYNDSFFYLKNLKSYLESLLGLAESVSTQRDYFSYLRKSYNSEQYVTTTIVPLEDDKSGLVVKNAQFNAYIHFRSIDGSKNDWDFTHNSEIPRFSYDIYKEMPERRDDNVDHKGIIALRPNLSVLRNKVLNKINFIEFFLHLLILVTFWLKFTVLKMPESVKEAWPVVKFFVNLFLYVLVCILIFIFDISFKFFGFFK